MLGAAQLACGDREGAKKTQSNMTKGCPGISQVRSYTSVVALQNPRCTCLDAHCTVPL